MVSSIDFITKQSARVVTLGLAAALTVSMASPFAAMAAADAIAATDHSTSVSSGEVQQALRYTPGVLDQSAQVTGTSDSDSALTINAATAGATVDIPKDASDGVSLGAANGPSLDISLPNADQAGDGKQVASGVVAYSSTNGSANAVQAENDGSVRMLTVIDNPSAPTTYDYKVTVPGGGRIELTRDGGAIILDSQNVLISSVSAPWAHDAKGRQLKTWFTTDGSTLRQYVRHNVKGVVYPVTADPWFWNYASCVLGIGIPISAALFIIANPATWSSLARMGAGVGGSGRVGPLVTYINWVKARCGAFIHS